MQPFYIGKGCGRRHVTHIEPGRLLNDKNRHKINTIQKIKTTTGKNPPIEIYASDLTNEEACFLESELIDFYGRADLKKGLLTNLTDGGESKVGWKATLEQRKKMSDSSPKYWLGKKLPEEIKQKMRKPKSEQAKQNMRKPKTITEKMKKSHEKFKNMIIAKDQEGNRLMITKNDPRWISGDLVGYTKGTQIGKNNPFFGKTHSAEFLNKKSKEQKGSIAAKDKNGKFFRVTKNDPRWISRELVGINKKIYC